ncbi:MAG: ATP-dependent Clp protease proteolytic subunit [Tissierellaceae bacterium]|nr:ATP-dependent Clp protease proteolytic subunit [Tissierellaceae bacterium]
MRKKLIGILLLVIILTFPTIIFAENNEVYVVPIKGEINKATYNFLKHNLERIQDAEAIIFEIDTYGGQIAEAEKIKNLILSIPTPTIAYVNTKAESAGVLITIAAEKVVVANSATIGSAEPIPNTEKVLSMWKAMLKDTAQYRNRDSQLVEAMADKDVLIEGISDRNKLLNLTSTEAIMTGIADFATDDYDELLDHFNLGDANVNKIHESLQIKLSKYISNPYVSSFLLTLGFVGMVVEILTPGFGIGGTVSIIGFGLYFGGNILGGNSHWTSLILFVTGLILLIIEAIVPGFGLPGISGIIFVLVGTVLAMESMKIALLSLSVAILITTIVTVVLIKMGFKSKMLRKIILDAEHKDEKGYLSVDSVQKYINKEGITLTELRPTGFIEVDGIKLDALSDEGFLPKSVPVKIVRVEGSKLFVRRF